MKILQTVVCNTTSKTPVNSIFSTTFEVNGEDIAIIRKTQDIVLYDGFTVAEEALTGFKDSTGNIIYTDVMFKKLEETKRVSVLDLMNIHFYSWYLSEYPEKTIFLNLSSETVSSQTCSLEILHTIASADVGTQLVVEITETGAVNLEQIKQFITHAQSLGVRVALDDFNCLEQSNRSVTEHYAMLKFKPDIIKLELPAEQTEHYQFFELLEHLYRQYPRIQFVIERIETAEQLKLFEGVQLSFPMINLVFQGYYFAKPAILEIEKVFPLAKSGGPSFVH